MANIKDMIGQTFTSVVGSIGETELVFTADNGKVFCFLHHQDCCEEVSIEDISGDLKDLIGCPLLKAEETISKNPDDDFDQSFTWTFYHFATINGYVNVRWLGTSNGYYSESVALVVD